MTRKPPQGLVKSLEIILKPKELRSCSDSLNILFFIGYSRVFNKTLEALNKTENLVTVCDRCGFSEISLNGFVGAGTFSNKTENTGVLGNQVVIPGLYTVLNTAGQSGLYGYQARKINSLYGSAEFSFADNIYLTATARNDWFSTLSAEGKTTPNNDLYGSVSLSVLLSDMVELPEAISFAKIRGGYSQVAGGAGNPYGLGLTYGLVGQGHLGSPLGAINGLSLIHI